MAPSIVCHTCTTTAPLRWLHRPEYIRASSPDVGFLILRGRLEPAIRRAIPDDRRAGPRLGSCRALSWFSSVSQTRAPATSHRSRSAGILML